MRIIPLNNRCWKHTHTHTHCLDQVHRTDTQLLFFIFVCGYVCVGVWVGGFVCVCACVCVVSVKDRAGSYLSPQTGMSIWVAAPYWVDTLHVFSLPHERNLICFYKRQLKQYLVSSLLFCNNKKHVFSRINSSLSFIVIIP